MEEHKPSGFRRRIASFLYLIPVLLPVGILIVLVIAIALIAVGAYLREWEWTGFLNKSLWNWMQLLLVPIILALGGLFFTQMERLNNARGQELTQQQLRQTQERLEIDAEQTRRTMDLNLYGQGTQRFIQAIDQLSATDDNGNARLEVRLGGIYALERTAQEDRNYHWAIMEVLTAYVREYAFRRPAVTMEEEVDTVPPLRPDVQAILTIIGRRSPYHTDLEYGIIDLRYTALRGADLEGAYLKRTTLHGADLREANLSRANLQEANLSNAELSDAFLSDAFLRDANLYGATLKDADLSGAILSRANLHDADLSDTDLSDAKLSYANLSGASLNDAVLNGAVLSYANLDGAFGVTNEKLEQQAESLEGATMPNGERHQ